MSFEYYETVTKKVHAYSVSLSKQYVQALQIFQEVYNRKRKGVEMKELKSIFSDNQYRNFAKLRHFNVISLDGIKWHLTPVGEAFLLGQSPIWNVAGWLGKQTLNSTHPAWLTFKGKRNLVYVNDYIEKSFKTREEYQKEKQGNTLL